MQLTIDRLCRILCAPVNRVARGRGVLVVGFVKVVKKQAMAVLNLVLRAKRISNKIW